MTYPEIVDDPTKDLIFDFFQYREVCDNDKFNTFFNRTLNTAMRKYNQLLRIQPGQVIGDIVVTYDWLVQEYKERQSSMTKGVDHYGYTTDTNSRSSSTENGGDVVTTDIRHDTTDRLSSRMTGEEGQDSTSTVSEDERNLLDSSAREDVSNNTSSSVDTNSHTGSDSSNDKSLGKNAPQSISYSGGGSGMPSNLDWQYPGEQSESKHSGSDSSDDDRAASTIQDGDVISSDTSAHTGTQSASGSSLTDKVNSRDESGVENTEFSGDGTTTVTDRSTVDVLESGEIRRDVNLFDSEDALTRDQENGRSLDIATLLSNAKDFILGSSAWDFLYGQLDKCFISVL